MSNIEGEKTEAPVEAQKPKPEIENKKPVKAEGKKTVKAKKKPAKKAAKKKAPKKVAKKAKVKKAAKKRAKGKKAAKTARVLTTVNFKVVPAEAKMIKAKATKLCNGNVTQMVRLAVIAWKPNRKKLPEFRPTTRA